MNWCQPHWTGLREAIEARPGLGDLIAADGKRAMENTKRELEGQAVTLATFDPLMSSFWAINSNATRIIGESTGSGAVFYLLGEGDEDVVDPERYPRADGRTWPRCPLCYLGLAHELTCDGCEMPKVDGFAWMIDRAADEAVKTLEQLRADEAKT